VALRHIESVKDNHGGHIVNHPVYHFLKRVEKQQCEIKEAQGEKQTNTEHGEVNLQLKAHASAHKLVHQI